MNIKDTVIYMLIAVLGFTILVNKITRNGSSPVSKIATGLFTTSGQALITDDYFLVADRYGAIIDLHDVKFNTETYQSLLSGGHRTYMISRLDNGKLSIATLHE